MTKLASPPGPHVEAPDEWLSELYRITDTGERAQFLQTLVELGISTINLEDGVGTKSNVVPDGFESSSVLAAPARLRADQFDALRVPMGYGYEFDVDIAEYVTDAGRSIRVCDLRPFMPSSLNKIGPNTTQDKDKLNSAFWRDIKVLAETGTPRATVSQVRGVAYTSVGSTKLRTYWMMVADNAHRDGVRTVARLADSGNNAGQEERLYSRLFGVRM